MIDKNTRWDVRNQHGQMCKTNISTKKLIEYINHYPFLSKKFKFIKREDFDFESLMKDNERIKKALEQNND